MVVRTIGWLVLASPGMLLAQEVGPAHGTLVIAGGGNSDESILKRFLEIAGGRDAPVVVIPTAGGGNEYRQDWSGLSGLRAVGASNLTVLHTYDRDEANSDAFVAPLRKARGVWIPGGRQWRLADAYLHTRVHHELRALLERGGVIGGTSAGASIQGSYLVRGDTRGNEVVMGDHDEGLGFLKNTAIDQHLLRRNRHFDLLALIEQRPELLGIGIDENTAIVVRGDEFQVMGESYVVIYDANRRLDSGGPFYFLAAGDVFDLQTRTPYRQRRALDRVLKEPWRAISR